MVKARKRTSRSLQTKLSCIASYKLAYQWINSTHVQIETKCLREWCHQYEALLFLSIASMTILLRGDIKWLLSILCAASFMFDKEPAIDDRYKSMILIKSAACSRQLDWLLAGTWQKNYIISIIKVSFFFGFLVWYFPRASSCKPSHDACESRSRFFHLCLFSTLHILAKNKMSEKRGGH